MIMACDTLPAAPVYFFAGCAFLTSDKRRLLECWEGCDTAQPEREESRAEWERALAVEEQALEKEYVRLFLNPAGAPCSPWQSTNTAEPGLMGEAHHSALAFYRDAGLEPENDSEPADHIGLLLVFYGNLLDMGAPSDTLARFRSEHFGWMHGFCDRLESETRLEYFRLLACLTRRLVWRPMHSSSAA